MAKRPMYLQHVNVYVRNDERSKKWKPVLRRSRSFSVGTVAAHQHPIQAAMLAVIEIESGFVQ